jgi:flagellar hook-associated protein 3 FlgL
MRVTDLTKQNSVLRNVAANADRLQKLQENMASGRRINRLSDDPIAATQVQDFRTRLSYLDRVKQNIQNNFTWLDRTDAELAHIGEMLQRAKTLALAQSNDTADESTRRVTAEELQDIIDNMINAGNAKVGKVFIFAGSKTLTKPLELTPIRQEAVLNTDQIPTDERLLLNKQHLQADFEGWSQHEYIARIVKEGEMGRAQFKVSDDGGKTWSREKTLLPKAEMVNESGAPSDKVYLVFNGQTLDTFGDPVVFPKGLEYRFTSNPPLAYKGNDDKRMVAVGEGQLLPINLTARDLYFRDPKRDASLDVFDMMYGIKRALEDNDTVTLEKRLNDLDRSLDQVLSRRADVGSVRKEMEDQLDKSKDREFQGTKQMSDLEDLDFPAAVTEMNLADVRNKATMDTSGRLIQPSLLNFLR